jgi:hypothetical protein
MYSHDYAIAIDENYNTVFDLYKIPWDVYTKTYLGFKISLECLPCFEGCQSCMDGMILLKEEKKCFWGNTCPANYTLVFDDPANKTSPYCILD